VRLDAPGAAPERSSPGGALPRRSGRGKKSVELLRVGPRVQAVQLTCSCGEVSVIEFDYPEDSPSGDAS
jgi:hypothetical protein